MLHRLRADDGFSLIAALLITLVVFAMSTVSFILSTHNTTQSGRNRERVNAVAAAEAGLNYQFSRLQAGTIECSSTQSLGSFPASGFTTTLTPYDLAGAELSCPPPSMSKLRMRIRSVGSATGSEPRRTMEALVELERPVGGTLGDGAIFGEGDIMIDSNPDIGNPAGDFDADVYSNGNIELKSNPKIIGNVTAQKCVKMDSTAQVYLDVWAKGGAGCAWSATVSMLSTTKVLNDVIATTGPIEFNSGARVTRDAKSGGTMTWQSPCPSGNSCGPNVHPRVGNMALRNQTGLLPPPSRSFPVLTYNEADWIAAGYTIDPPYTSCSAAKSAIGNNNTVKRVIRVTSTCELLWSASSSAPITLSQDLAIVTNGTVFIDSGTRFIASAPRTLHMIVAQQASYQPDYCFQMKSTTRIEVPISTLVYVPKKADQSKCKVFLDSNADIAQGQIFGGNKIDVKSNTDLAYTPVITPGAPVTGFKESVIYIREIRSN
jgi:hypothetical protein